VFADVFEEDLVEDDGKGFGFEVGRDLRLKSPILGLSLSLSLPLETSLVS